MKKIYNFLSNHTLFFFGFENESTEKGFGEKFFHFSRLQNITGHKDGGFSFFTSRNALLKKIGLFGLLPILLISCNSYKKVLYFQNIDRAKVKKEKIDNYSPLVIQTEDILQINVASLNPEASAIFSFSSASSGGGASSGSEYLVDHEGKINFPLLGSLNVTGITTSDLREKIRQQLLIYLKEPIVNIRIVNFKVSIIGDVASPGVYNVQNEKISIPEVLSMAGDINLSAKRNNIILIREQDGNREFIPIDLTQNIFQSPYYYLKNNDLVYVQPDRNKVGGAWNTFNAVVSLISVASLVIQILR